MVFYRAVVGSSCRRLLMRSGVLTGESRKHCDTNYVMLLTNHLPTQRCQLFPHFLHLQFANFSPSLTSIQKMTQRKHFTQVANYEHEKATRYIAPSPQPNKFRPHSDGASLNVIDTTFTESNPDKPAGTTPIETPQREFYTADMNPSILNQLFGQALKLLHVAAAFAPAAFVRNPGAALKTGTASGSSGAGGGMSLNILKTFLVQQRQRTRAGSADNPTTSKVPVVNRRFLEGTGGPPTRVKKVQMLRVMHAKEDAESEFDQRE